MFETRGDSGELLTEHDSVEKAIKDGTLTMQLASEQAEAFKSLKRVRPGLKGWIADKQWRPSWTGDQLEAVQSSIQFTDGQTTKMNELLWPLKVQRDRPTAFSNNQMHTYDYVLLRKSNKTDKCFETMRSATAIR